MEGASSQQHMRATNLSFKRAKTLRRIMSPPEVRIWNRLRRRSEGGIVFRRQHPMGPYILDFYCSRARLAIEIDGWGHNMGDRPDRDTRKDAWLTAQGVRVLRISASEVLADPDGAADRIWQTAAAYISGDLP